MQDFLCVVQKKITTLLPGGKSVAWRKYKSFCSKTKFQGIIKCFWLIWLFKLKPNTMFGFLRLLVVVFCVFPGLTGISQLQFKIKVPAGTKESQLDGRLLLLISKDSTTEPRFGIADGYKSQQVTGIDVENHKPGEEIIIDTKAFGYPLESLAELKPGRYRVQALLHKYETFHLTFPWLRKDNSKQVD